MAEYKVLATALDERELQKAKRVGIQKSRLMHHDFSNSITFKPWGYEYLFHENANKSACGWVLHFKTGYGTSLHCHEKKSTVLYVLSGMAKLNLLNKNIILYNDDRVFMDAKVFHSIYSFATDTLIIELEMPSDKIDSVRLLDVWNRELKPYEEGCKILNILINTTI